MSNIDLEYQLSRIFVEFCPEYVIFSLPENLVALAYRIDPTNIIGTYKQTNSIAYIYEYKGL